jgi:hypothetical protein
MLYYSSRFITSIASSNLLGLSLREIKIKSKIKNINLKFEMKF